MPLQLGDGLVWPVGVLDLVQLCLGEDVVEVFDSHLVEGDHVLKLVQLGQTGQSRERETSKEKAQITVVCVCVCLCGAKKKNLLSFCHYL